MGSMKNSNGGTVYKAQEVHHIEVKEHGKHLGVLMPADLAFKEFSETNVMKTRKMEWIMRTFKTMDLIMSVVALFKSLVLSHFRILFTVVGFIQDRRNIEAGTDLDIIYVLDKVNAAFTVYAGIHIIN